MRILAVESSAAPASAAIWQDGHLLGEHFLNTGQTHSQTLLPLVENLLTSLELTCNDIDLFAVTNGPGSFTGVRIGVSCVKGLAFPQNTPCVGVSTLAAIAAGGQALEGAVLCAAMDARRAQVYNALFEVKNGELVRLTEDRAISIADLTAECAPFGERVVLFGDGAALCYESMKAIGARLAPVSIRYQRASSAAFLAERAAQSGAAVSPAALLPTYLRPPQAERELKLKKEQGVKES